MAKYGPGIYGCQAASRYYFKKPASELTEHEAAQLAASLPIPRYWHPGTQNGYYANRVEMIKRRDGKGGFFGEMDLANHQGGFHGSGRKRSDAPADLAGYQKGAIVSRTVMDKPAGTVTFFAFERRPGPERAHHSV